MLRYDQQPGAKRPILADHRKKNFAKSAYKAPKYPHRLNFYGTPPTADITLEEFEQWAIDRLRVLGELEACIFRNKSFDETVAHMRPLLNKYLYLGSNTSASNEHGRQELKQQREKDHYSHFILRLAFCATENLRRRFARVETMLFRLRLDTDDMHERDAFVQSLDVDCERVSADERRGLGDEFAQWVSGMARHKASASPLDDEKWRKCNWERVPDLVEQRRVFVQAGKAYIPAREQSNMVVAEFTARLDRALQLTARALPRLDEDDRLTPILDHLAKNFIMPDAGYRSGGNLSLGTEITAQSVDDYSPHFPLCMMNLHQTLRRDAHLKHYGRLQYTLFLKGIGLSLPECLEFWRRSFHKVSDDTFNKEYRYNVRHAYGDVGGDSNRRGGGYSPFSCQKVLTEHPPGAGEAHGCPYRHFDMDNLTALLERAGVTDWQTLQGVREDKRKLRFHIACNRVFESLHKQELKRAKEEGTFGPAQMETIVHPNEYFKRSLLLKSHGKT